MRSTRALEAYDPAVDLGQHWPDWSVYESTAIPAGAELFLPGSKVVFVEASACGADWALAHVAAHLDLEHHHLVGPDGFTAEQESEASWLASVRMAFAPAPGLPQRPLGVTFLQTGPTALAEARTDAIATVRERGHGCQTDPVSRRSGDRCAASLRRARRAA